MNFFLKLRHWQVFALVYAPPTAVILFVRDFDQVNKSAPIASMVSMIVLFSWIYALGKGLFKYRFGDSELNFKYFQLVAAVLAFGYMIVSITVIVSRQINLLLPVILVLIICLVYVVCFAARALREAELQSTVAYHDCVNEIFLFLFFPIGVWLLQPRINKLFE